MTPTEFLLARIAEDESAARAEVTPYFVDSDHQARWTPSRTLAECEAKRRIVRRHRPIPVGIPEITCHCCRANWPCLDLRSLAAVYADHFDYREVWKP